MGKEMRRISAAFFTIWCLIFCVHSVEAKGTVEEITASVTSVSPIPTIVRQ
ncbi:MAG: hypothetical protein J6I74_02510 [Schwartzia sp.]|nr:hypothetical protein [Schwartzia sp. (in: firmicutes)]